jgi:hypothetical protein
MPTLRPHIRGTSVKAERSKLALNGQNSQVAKPQRCTPSRWTEFSKSCLSSPASCSAKRLEILIEADLGSPPVLPDFCNKLSQKLLQQLVYHLWCVLLHPVGYTGQPFHCKMSYIALSAV